MTYKDELSNEYFEWMYNIACGDRYSKETSFRKLLMHLHDVEFIYYIFRDENRAQEGIDLRYRFGLVSGHDDACDVLNEPCSVLEMILALAIRCEENFMDDPTIGDRTAQWFWGMVVNMGLGGMTDERYDRRFVDDIVTRFLERDYEPNGKGGLFTIDNCKYDLREVEIWYQFNWYIKTIV